MVIITCLYLLVVYLVFHKFKLLPWNKTSQAIALILGIIILTAFLVGLQGLTPASEQGTITGPITEIAPMVSGAVVAVPAAPNLELLPRDVIFEVDPVPYQYRVDQLQAQLVDTEAGVAQLKETYDAARSQTASVEAQLELTQLRLRQSRELVAAEAGSRFELEQYEAQEQQLQAQLEAARANEKAAYINLTASVGDKQSKVAQVLAQLESAQYDLANTRVRAPGPGVVTQLVLRPGMQVSPSRAAATFLYTDQLMIAALFQQKALQNVKIGDKAKINFPALPGRLFESEVILLPVAVGEAQFFASGQLASTQEQRMTRLYPVHFSIPEDFPPELLRAGLAASVRIHTEKAGVVGIVALVLQWIQTSLDAVM